MRCRFIMKPVVLAGLVFVLILCVLFYFYDHNQMTSSDARGPLDLSSIGHRAEYSKETVKYSRKGSQNNRKLQLNEFMKDELDTNRNQGVPNKRLEVEGHPWQSQAESLPKNPFPRTKNQSSHRSNVTGRINEPSTNAYLPRGYCSDVLCTNVLSKEDLFNFTSCKRRAEAVYTKMFSQQSSGNKNSEFVQNVVKGQLVPSGKCRFMNGSGRSPVGLVSFPGSGNTWVRGLLQKATGICTGMVCVCVCVCVCVA